MSVDINRFLAGVQQIADSKPTYRAGGSGRDGTCDCVGLIIGAMRLAGFVWKGDHSSNWVPRRATRNLHIISNAGELEVCDLVYKFREPGDPRYKLPERFRNGPDNRDYYHVGVVISVYPLKIMHCTQDDYYGINGITVDTRLGRWLAVGKLSYLTGTIQGAAPGTPSQQQKEAYIVLYEAEVTTSGGTLNIRFIPSMAGQVIHTLEKGTRVRVIREVNAEWAEIEGPYGQGYAARKFLVRVPSEQAGSTITNTPAVVIPCGSIQEAEAIIIILRNAQARQI